MAWPRDAIALFAKNPLSTYALYAARTLLAQRRFVGFRAHYLASWKDSRFEPHVTLFSEASVTFSSIGTHSYVGARARVDHARVGRYCSLGPEVLIGLGKHPSQFAATSPHFYSVQAHTGPSLADRDYFQERAETFVGHDVWLGARAMVLDGVRVGDGAIVAAGAVVTKDIAPYTIAAGVPARPIRTRFDEATIRFLLDFRWWDRDEAWLREHFRELHDPGALMSRYGNG